MTTLVDALPVEQARCRVILGHAKEIGAPGRLLCMLIEQSLCSADVAAASGDVVAMVRALEDLRGYKE